MKKIVMVQLLKGTKEKIVRPEKKEVKPLEIYYIGENRSELLYDTREKVISRTTGLFGNTEVTEITNAYGVKLKRNKKVFR